MIFQYKSKFKESAQSEKELTRLAHYILGELAKRVLDWRKQTGKQFEKDKTYSFSVWINNSFRYNTPFMKDFISWLIRRDFLVTFTNRTVGQSETIRGLYNDRDHEIQIKIELRSDLTFIYDNIKELSWFFRDKYLKVLTHELEHVYDDFISSGHYISKDYISSSEKDGYKKYMSQNLEINARYAATVGLPIMEESRIVSTFDNYLSNFKNEFEGWEFLNKDQQKQIINRLYKRYTEPINPKYKVQVLNNLSNRYFFSLLDSMKNPVLEDKRIPGVNKRTVINYAKETVYKMLSGKVNQSESGNYKIIKNRYSGLRYLKQSAELVSRYQTQLEKSEIYKILQKRIETELEKNQIFMRAFGLSNDQFAQLLININKYM